MRTTNLLIRLKENLRLPLNSQCKCAVNMKLKHLQCPEGNADKTIKQKRKTSVSLAVCFPHPPSRQREPGVPDMDRLLWMSDGTVEGYVFQMIISQKEGNHSEEIKTYSWTEELPIGFGLPVPLHNVVVFCISAVVRGGGTDICKLVKRGVYPVAPHLRGQDERQFSTYC